MGERASSTDQLILNFPYQLNDTFANFIESDSSSLALKAAKSLCKTPDISFQTLFIAGEPGLGKTHLLRAIGNYVASSQPGEKAHYLDAARFVQCLMEGETKALENALNQILESDYFLLDNVHKISDSLDAQEKLHFIYNQLNQKKKKIVFTALELPQHLAGLADYLKSRFQWGMIVQLKPIQDATTAEILYKISGDLGLELPDSITTYLLNHIARDYPSLRKAVDAINEASYLKKRKVTLTLVKEALSL